MVNAEVKTNQSVVERVSSLPLVSSTYSLVFGVYSSTKNNNPYIRSVCEAAEQGVRTVTSVAFTTASPIIDRLEPQIAMANSLACKGLDRIEKTLPVLQKPSEQIVSNAKEAMTGKVTSAKDSVSETLSGVVQRTRGVVEDRVVKTKAAVSGSVNSVLESKVLQLVSSGVDTALSTSESLLERYLPPSDDEIEPEAEEKGERSYYTRLGYLSARLRKRAAATIRSSGQQSVAVISKLNPTEELIQYGQKNLNNANQLVNNKLSSLVVWKTNVKENSHQAEMIESRTLTLAHSLTQQLQTTCLVLLSGMQGLPNHLQHEALSLSHSAAQVYAKATTLPDLVVTTGKYQMGKVKGSLDGVVDYLINNTPLNWLVGPFYPQLPTALHQPHAEEPRHVEMRSMRRQVTKL